MWMDTGLGAQGQEPGARGDSGCAYAQTQRLRPARAPAHAAAVLAKRLVFSCRKLKFYTNSSSFGLYMAQSNAQLKLTTILFAIT